MNDNALYYDEGDLIGFITEPDKGTRLTPAILNQTVIHCSRFSCILNFSVWREIPGTDYCFDSCGGGSCAKCDNGYCCSGDTNSQNSDCPKSAINAVSTASYRCVKEHDVLSESRYSNLKLYFAVN